MVSQEVGSRIKEVRESNGLRKSEFARLLGVSAAWVSYAESGKRGVSETMLTHIADKFGVPLPWLMGKTKYQLLDPRQEIMSRVWLLVSNYELEVVRNTLDEIIKNRKRPVTQRHYGRHRTVTQDSRNSQRLVVSHALSTQPSGVQ